MELLLPLVCGLLVAVGLFLVLDRALIRVIVGISMVGYGVNLAVLVASADPNATRPPLLGAAGPYADPLPQALILTAIVIGFGTTALLLVLTVRAYQVAGTDHVQELADRPDPVDPPRVYADPQRPSVSPEAAPAPATTGDDPSPEGEP